MKSCSISFIKILYLYIIHTVFVIKYQCNWLWYIINCQLFANSWYTVCGYDVLQTSQTWRMTKNNYFDPHVLYTVLRAITYNIQNCFIVFEFIHEPFLHRQLVHVSNINTFNKLWWTFLIHSKNFITTNISSKNAQNFKCSPWFLYVELL